MITLTDLIATTQVRETIPKMLDMIPIDTPVIKPKSSKSALGRALLLVAALVFSFPQTGAAQEAQPREYSTLTAERVAAALADGAGKNEIALAEGSLTALGWFVLYGNDDDSQSLAERLKKVVFDAYHGTDHINVLQEQQQYGEMLKLNRFEKRKPMSPSPEYTQLTKDRVDKALAEGAGTEDFKLAEGSLCALGWLTLYGNDAASLKKGEALMNSAFKAWPGSNEVYMLITTSAYGEIINLGQFKTTPQLPATGTSVPAPAGGAPAPGLPALPPIGGGLPSLPPMPQLPATGTSVPAPAGAGTPQPPN